MQAVSSSTGTVRSILPSPRTKSPNPPRPCGRGYRRALVLDVSLKPVDVVSWRRAILLDLFGKVDVLEYYEDDFISTPNDLLPVPAVLKVHCYRRYEDRKRKQHSVNRAEVFARDCYTCQYCGSTEVHRLSIDHVLPTSRGGPWTWDNLVVACQECNTKKGARTPEEAGMALQSQPRAPRSPQILPSGQKAAFNNPPKEWLDFIR